LSEKSFPKSHRNNISVPGGRHAGHHEVERANVLVCVSLIDVVLRVKPGVCVVAIFWNDEKQASHQVSAAEYLDQHHYHFAQKAVDGCPELQKSLENCPAIHFVELVDPEQAQYPKDFQRPGNFVESPKIFRHALNLLEEHVKGEHWQQINPEEKFQVVAANFRDSYLKLLPLPVWCEKIQDHVQQENPVDAIAVDEVPGHTPAIRDEANFEDAQQEGVKDQNLQGALAAHLENAVGIDHPLRVLNLLDGVWWYLISQKPV